MTNMELWDKFKQPPARALKEIRGGRLSGKTDINPQWRYESLTEHFGPCGIGWKYEIKEHWTAPGSGGEVMAFVVVHLYIRSPFDAQTISNDPETDGPWSYPIPGIGGSMLIANEKGGLHANDEAFKMATTDALSVACKLLGIGSDIYAGMYDGSKYRDASDAPTAPRAEPTRQPEGKAGGDPDTVDGFVQAISMKNDPQMGVKVNEVWFNTEDTAMKQVIKAAKDDHQRIMFDWKWRTVGDRKSKYLTKLVVFDEQGEIVHQLPEA